MAPVPAEKNIPEDLLVLMEQCGHFIWHRMGGKKGQIKILKILSKNPEITQAELQSKLNIQPGSISEIMTKMENKGLITKTKDEEDKRKYVISITEKGKKNLCEHPRNDFAGKKGLFDVLDEQEQEELRRILSRLIENWEERFGKGCLDRRQGRKTDAGHTVNIKENVNETSVKFDQ